jgi:hypothetical protein
MTVRVFINGFGRIGRNVLRAIVESERGDIEIVGINDLGPVEINAHLLRFDSVHGRFPVQVSVFGDLKTLLWNGPVGAFEIEPFGRGTFALAEAAARLSQAGKLRTVAGGGDTVAALAAADVTDSFSNVSTAGGHFWNGSRDAISRV